MKIFGKVIQGKGKGGRLGFPTVNVELREKIDSGVFAGSVLADGKKYKAGIFTGPNKQILEAHLVDFSGNLYGKEIEIEIGEKIRDVINFKSDEELKKQIADDLQVIRNW